MPRKVSKLVALILAFSLLFQQTGFAQIAPQLNIAAGFTRFTPVPDRFRPIHLRYLAYDELSENFRLLLDKGDLKDPASAELSTSTQTLMNYFFIGLTLPNDAFWVNLRPDAPERIIDDNLARTEMGRVLLEADVQLKKDTAKATSPETPEGKEYWARLYQKADELFGQSQDIDIPANVRPWIVPGEIIIGETGTSAYIYKATLRVLLEEDYLKNQTAVFSDPRMKALNEYSAELLRELIIPKLMREVNASKRYAPLRQVYYSLILSQWFKQRFKDKLCVYSSRIDKQDLTGLTSLKPWSKDGYYKQYLKSLKDGEYRIQDTCYASFGETTRTYVSGGVRLGINAFPGLGASSAAATSIDGTKRTNGFVRFPGAVPVSFDHSQVLVEPSAQAAGSPVTAAARVQRLEPSPDTKETYKVDAEKFAGEHIIRPRPQEIPADFLARLAYELNISRSDLAKGLGISPQTLSKFINEQREVLLSLDFCVRLGEVCGFNGVDYYWDVVAPLIMGEKKPRQLVSGVKPEALRLLQGETPNAFIKRFRMAHGLTQQHVADQVGMRELRIYEIERDTNPPPNLRFMARFVEVFGLNGIEGVRFYQRYIAPLKGDMRMMHIRSIYAFAAAVKRFHELARERQPLQGIKAEPRKYETPWAFLERLEKEYGVEDADLIEALGVTRVTLWKLKTGRQIPRPAQIMALGIWCGFDYRAYWWRVVAPLHGIRRPSPLVRAAQPELVREFLGPAPGKRIRQLRNGVHMNLIDFGSLLGVSGPFLHYLETGRRTLSPELLINLGELFGFDGWEVLRQSSELQLEAASSPAAAAALTEYPAPSADTVGPYAFDAEKISADSRIKTLSDACKNGGSVSLQAVDLTRASFIINNQEHLPIGPVLDTLLLLINITTPIWVTQPIQGRVQLSGSARQKTEKQQRQKEETRKDILDGLKNAMKDLAGQKASDISPARQITNVILHRLRRAFLYLTGQKTSDISLTVGEVIFDAWAGEVVIRNVKGEPLGDSAVFAALSKTQPTTPIIFTLNRVFSPPDQYRVASSAAQVPGQSVSSPAAAAGEYNLAAGQEHRRVMEQVVKLNQLATREHKRGNFDKALEYLNEAKGIMPDNWVTWTQFATVYFKQGRYQEALDAAETALGLNGRHVPPYLIRAQALLKLGRNNDALASVEEALSIDQAHIQTYIIGVHALHKMGDFEGARQFAEPADGLELRDPREHKLRAQLYHNLGLDVNRRGDVDAVLGANPGDADMLRLLAASARGAPLNPDTQTTLDSASGVFLPVTQLPVSLSAGQPVRSASSPAKTKFKATLRETLGDKSIHFVLDAGTGRGEWMRQIRGQPWLADDAQVVGSELQDIDRYVNEEPWDRDVAWRGLTVVQDPNDARYPAAGTVDLIHESFIKYSASIERLDEFDRLLRDGGWFVFAHNDSEMERGAFIRWLTQHRYPYRVYDQNEIPADYPQSYWWGEMMKAQSRGEPQEHNYLIIARKILYANASSPADNTVRKQFIDDTAQRILLLIDSGQDQGVVLETIWSALRLFKRALNPLRPLKGEDPLAELAAQSVRFSIEERVGTFDQINAMGLDDFIKAIGVIEIPGSRVSLFAHTEDDAALVEAMRESAGGAEALWHKLSALFGNRPPETWPPAVWLFHPAVKGAGIYWDPATRDRAIRQLEKSDFYHEWIERSFQQDRAVDIVFLAIFGHAHPRVVQEDLWFAAQVGELDARIAVWNNEIARVRTRYSLDTGIEQTKRLYHLPDDFTRETIERYITEIEGYIASAASSPAEDRGSSSVQQPGGIDFRALPLAIQPPDGFAKPLPLVSINLDANWIRIQEALHNGSMPTAQVIVDSLRASCASENPGNVADQAMIVVADILRTQEEVCCETDNSMRAVLSLLESGKPAAELQIALSRL